MVIVEGCDGSGKSTLVKQLVDRFGLIVGERGVADRSLLYTVTRPDTYNALADAILGGSPKVWDRLYFSEMVYAPVVGRKCEFNAYERAMVEGVLRALKCPIIYCCPSFEVVRTNAAKAKQMSGVNENIAAIYADYERLFEHRAGFHSLRYDYTQEPVDKAMDFVDFYLSQRKQREISW